MSIILSIDELTLRSLQADDAPALLALLDADRMAFDPWLRWSSGVRSVDDAHQFIDDALLRERMRDGFHLGIVCDGALIGGVACWSIHQPSRTAEVGYWLAIVHRGRGIAECATRRVIEYLFDECNVERVELQCLVNNQPSRRLAERLGGRLEKVHRPDVAVNGAPRDHALYAITTSHSRSTATRADDVD